MEGTWWYNKGRSSYTIFAVAGSLRYYQLLGESRELYGDLKSPSRPSEWTKEAALSNGARLRLRLEGDRLVTSYQKAFSSEWRPDIYAERWAEQEAPATSASADRPAPRSSDSAGAPGASRVAASFGSREPPRLAPRLLTEHIREAVLRVFGAEDEDADDRPLTAACSMRQRLQREVPRARRSGVCLFDRLVRTPIAACIPKEALVEHQQERRQTARAPDPKSTIVPVPAVQLGLSLVHPISYSEEQMLRLFIGDPRNMAYNLSTMVRGSVALDARLAMKCHQLIVQRHDVLRSAYRQEDPQNPLRTVSRQLPGGVRMLVAATEADAQRLQLMDRAAAHQLGVTGIRCSVVMSSTDGVPSFGVNMHHILSDADGMSLYFNELMGCQLLFAAGYSQEAVLSALPKLPVQFVDFAYWQKSLEAQGHLDGDLSYWYKEVVSSTPPVVLDVPIDKPRPRMWMTIGASQRCLYDNELLTPLSEVTGRATPMAVTCTNFAIVLSRLSGNPFLDVAIPFALRNMPALMNLIGNFLNMMPVRMRHDPVEPYSSTLERIATSNINVQKYSLSQFIQLVEGTRKHFPVADPSRNPIYATMVDLVPNEAGDPSTALSGVLDVFLFVNTRQGTIWSIDAVYNTTILEEQTVRHMLLQMPAIARHAARSAREPVPRSLASCEEAQPLASGRVDVASLTLRVGLLPHVVPIRSGVEERGAPIEYFGIRRSRRLKRHSAMELAADYPPAALRSLQPPLPPLPAPAAKALPAAPPRAGQALATRSARPTPPTTTMAALAQRRGARAAVNTVADKAQSYEVVAKWAETQRISELISLDGGWPESQQHEPLEETDQQLLQRGRRRLAGRGRMQ